jgi:hypothetical protein
MSPERRRIFYAITSPDGTTINWKEAWVVLEDIDRLSGLLILHNAGLLGQGIVVPLLHTLNWTNCKKHNKHVVIICNLLCLI